MARAVAIAEGAADVADGEWLRVAFALALREGVPLETALGLPSTRARRREAMRNYWLAEAATHCSERMPWPRACELARAGRVFELRVWPIWRRRDCAPAEATGLPRALFELHRYGGRVPNARRVHDLLIAMNRQDIAVDLAASCLP